jgi:flagellar biosynthesis protein FlhG
VSAKRFRVEKDYFDKKSPFSESHEILKAYFPRQDSTVSDRINGRKIIIAIGGAKGGIGKSIFAANLGVFLASKGKRPVLVDLDLGGANLHLYLGERLLEKDINDFLSRRTPTLEKIMVPTRYGPRLIGGDSSQLGAANIHFAKKLELLRSIKKIDADYVIIDLGGDTSYNILDFFLAADQGIVMTTLEPASYLDAYSFIKVALYRKLNRLFGPESKFRTQKDRGLQRLIYEDTTSSKGSSVKNIEELLQRVKEQQPQSLSLVIEAISSFNPHLILNRVTHNSNVTQVVERIQEVSRKMLSIRIGYLGSLPYQSEIESSAMDLVPIVARYPEGDLAKKISVIIEKLLHG